MSLLEFKLDKTAEGKPQKFRVKTDWINGDGRISRNVTQLRKVQKCDGYAYQQIKSEHVEYVYVQQSLF